MILDTSAYSALQKGNKHAVQACRDADALYLPVVVIGELRYGFANGSQTEKNERILQKFLASRGVYALDVRTETTPIYATLYLHAKRAGKALSHNDFWVAALAIEHDEPLLTLDKDFAAFKPLLGKNLRLID